MFNVIVYYMAHSSYRLMFVTFLYWEQTKTFFFHFPSGPNNDKLFWKNSDSIITCNLIKDINSYVVLTFSIWSFWCAAIAPCKCHWLSLRMFTRLDTLTVYVLTIDGFFCYKLMTMISREITFWLFETKPCQETKSQFNDKVFLKILCFYNWEVWISSSVKGGS